MLGETGEIHTHSTLSKKGESRVSVGGALESSRDGEHFGESLIEKREKLVQVLNKLF